MKASLTKYRQETMHTKDHQSALLVKDTFLDSLREELDDHIKEYQGLDRRATRKAKGLMYFGLVGAVAQAVGLQAAIFHVSSWDVIEPMTFVLSAFWLTAGCAFCWA